MIAPDVLRAMRERDAAAITYHGRMPTVAQMDRRDLLREVDRVTRELQAVRAEIAASKVVVAVAQ